MVISLKRTFSSVPFAILGNTLNKPEEIANVLNKYFGNISSTIQSTTKFPKNKFRKFPPGADIDSLFTNPVDKTEVKNIILLSIL